MQGSFSLVSYITTLITVVAVSGGGIAEGEREDAGKGEGEQGNGVS
jgi:hypothetical protein